MNSDEQNASYLKNPFDMTYIKDIRDRNNIRCDTEFGELLDILASATGSLTDPQKLARTFRSKRNCDFSENTINRYCRHLEDAFLLNKSLRYDLKGKEYINTPFKYYFEDVGLRETSGSTSVNRKKITSWRTSFIMNCVIEVSR